MPVSNEHKLYTGNKRRWSLVRDCIEGQDVIKSKRETYLPKLSGQEPSDYDRYIDKAQFFGATGRAADGLHGSVFAKPATHTGDMSENFIELLEDVDLMGTSLEQFASDIIWDNMQTNWGGILTDYSKEDRPTSLLEAEKAGHKAFLRWYSAEYLINWKYDIKDGIRQLVLVVLKEPNTAEKDKFTEEEYEKYRVLYFDEKGDYVQDIFDSRIDLDNPVLEETAIKPILDGKPLKVIPFFPCPGKEPEKSMLLDLAYQNISHYQQSADYENGKHYTSIPSPVALGYRPQQDENGKPIPVKIGGTKFTFFYNDTGEKGEVKYLEFSGAGIKTLQEGMVSTEEHMAVLGAHIITGEKKGVETAAAAKIHRSGENGVLSAFVRNISGQLTKAVRLKARWDGISEEEAENWSFALNTDYDMIREDAQILNVLLNGRNSGEIPRISLFRALKNIELIPEEWDFDTFLEETENDAPHPPPVIIAPQQEGEEQNQQEETDGKD